MDIDIFEMGRSCEENARLTSPNSNFLWRTVPENEKAGRLEAAFKDVGYSGAI